jgi:hypothetical protein
MDIEAEQIEALGKQLFPPGASPAAWIGKLAEDQQNYIDAYGPGSPPQHGTLFSSAYDPYECPDRDRVGLDNAREQYWIMQWQHEQVRAKIQFGFGVTGPAAVPAIAVAKHVPNHKARKRGPRSRISERVCKEMAAALQNGEFDPDSLDGMKEEGLSERFDCSRDTARKARNTVLGDAKARSGKKK